MKTGSLHGRAHTELGKIESRHTERAAITLSLGGAAKTYSHTDPNEDSAAFVESESGIFLAVADGHSGCDAAECAVNFLLEKFVPQWLAAKPPIAAAAADATAQRGHHAVESPWTPLLLDALIRANEAIAAHLAAQHAARAARTTLTFAVIRPRENLFAYASIGDSHLFRIARKSAIDVVCQHSPSGRHFFLGMPAKEAQHMSQLCVTGQLPLDGVQAIALATDGLSERGIGVAFPENVVAEAATRALEFNATQRAITIAHLLTETANTAHRTNASGDNMACAVAWLAPCDKSETAHPQDAAPAAEPKPTLDFFGDALKRR